MVFLYEGSLKIILCFSDSPGSHNDVNAITMALLGPAYGTVFSLVLRDYQFLLL